MTSKLTKLERQLRGAGILVAIGLVVELISLLWNHPTAFFLFLGVGALMITAGVLLYFFSLVTEPTPGARKAQTERDVPQRPIFDLHAASPGQNRA